MEIERRVVNNYVFLLGLDNLYRDAIKQHEREELLDCARQVAAALQVLPANGPVEGYYAEDAKLTEYFLYIRALQQVDESRTSEVASLPEFCRLLDIASSPIYGRPQQNEMLLPVGRDAFSQALIQAQPDWNVRNLTSIAFTLAHEMDDYSLVGLAARVKNSVVLTAPRESVVLYAETVCLIESRRQESMSGKSIMNLPVRPNDLSIHSTLFLTKNCQLLSQVRPNVIGTRMKIMRFLVVAFDLDKTKLKLRFNTITGLFVWARRGWRYRSFGIRKYGQPLDIARP